ncbi:MAG: hypothetical protein ACD_65C00155G0002 [uncultured bacterium]|nr:MAG: hypothetical protein ACD_65C00155G0002 [uncultured bacterium]
MLLRSHIIQHTVPNRVIIFHFSSILLVGMNSMKAGMNARNIHPMSIYIPCVPWSFIVWCQGRVMYLFNKDVYPRYLSNSSYVPVASHRERSSPYSSSRAVKSIFGWGCSPKTMFPIVLLGWGKLWVSK